MKTQGFRVGTAPASASRRPEPDHRVPLRVAWVAEIPVPYRVGLYRRLREEAGIDLKLLFCAATQPGRDWEVSLEGVPHVVLPGVTLAVKPGELFFLRINPQVWDELSRFHPDVVVVGGYAHVTMQIAMLWCRCTGTPYLMNSESHHWRKRGGLRRVLKWLPVQFFVRGAAAGLPAGTLAREYLLSYGGAAERMFFLPNTCDVARFARQSDRARSRRAALRAELGVGAGALLLYVGRLAPGKGLDTLLHAFQAVSGDRAVIRASGGPALPSPSLLLVGDGEQRAALAELAAALGVGERVRFAGSRSWAELPTLYAAADLVVLPSTFEAWGAVVNEALACGLPVIVSDQVGCAPDLVRPGENGWIVPAGDAAALAAAVRAALADSTKLAAMGAVSAQLAPAWSENACLEAVMAALKAAVRQRTPQEEDVRCCS